MGLLQKEKRRPWSDWKRRKLWWREKRKRGLALVGETFEQFRSDSPSEGVVFHLCTLIGMGRTKYMNGISSYHNKVLKHLIDLKGTPYNSCFISLHPRRTTILPPAVVLNVFHNYIVLYTHAYSKNGGNKNDKKYIREWSPLSTEVWGDTITYGGAIYCSIILRPRLLRQKQRWWELSFFHLLAAISFLLLDFSNG